MWRLSEGEGSDGVWESERSVTGFLVYEVRERKMKN